MALRRLVQQNNASSSPRSPLSAASPISSSSNAPPSTPRNRPVHDLYRSPASTPSISSSIPFDWEAARARRPPPYATPIQNRTRKSVGTGTGPSATGQRRAVVRKKGFIEKVKSVPSTIAFQIALFPNNLPLPAPKTSARIIGAIMHFINLCVRISRIRKVPDTELEWPDWYREVSEESWFDWSIPVTILLISGTFLNAIYLFTRIKVYRLHKNQDLVASPHAKFVSAELDVEPLESPSLAKRVGSAAWYTFSCSWRFLLGFKQPSRSSSVPNKVAKVQQLDMWHPGELEMELFTIYSPVHALLWMAVGTSNWILMLLVMGLISVQLNALTYSYNSLVKDKEILSAEVMSEYNQRFVYPRINPVRRDVAVMTHQSEVVNVWED